MKNKRLTNGWIYWLIILIVLVAMNSCASTKGGCGSYDNWISKHKTFNK